MTAPPRIAPGRLLALAVLVALVASGCSEKEEPLGPAPPTTISVSGASALVPFLRRAGDRFEEADRGVVVEVRAASTAEAEWLRRRRPARPSGA